jgi:hypothetical protein
MLARLVFLNGSKAGTTLQLEEKDVTIGRKPQSTVAYSPDEILVSTEHARIVFQGGAYLVRDDGSRNGTFVNSQPVKEKKLEHGDLIQFGPGGPSARFVVGNVSGVAHTLDLAAQSEKRAAELLGQPEQTLRTRDLVAVTYGRLAKQTRQALIAVAVIVVALGAVVVWQMRSRARLEQALTELSAELLASRTAMEQNLAAVEARYAAMREQATSGERRLAGLPRVDLAALNQFTRSVPLIVYSYGFTERNGTQFLRYVLDSRGQTVTTRGSDGRDVPTLSFAGSGPPVRRFGIATGVVIDTVGSVGGYILTTRRAVEPWRDAPEIAAMRARGLALNGKMIELKAYFPPGDRSFPLFVDRVSDSADVAIARTVGGQPGTPPVPVAPDTASIGTGDQLLSISYPAELDQFLFRLDSMQRVEIRQRVAGDDQRLLDLLIERRMIVPVITDGRITTLSATELTHAATGISPASGAPLVDGRRRLVGLELGGPASALRGVPIRHAWDILPARVQRIISRRAQGG